ncbi:hypothetical protein DICVIV_11034 [Dictyocaulus viviparus]|uniref:Uncharacterized protein n=1 Tax=Dictyocaulus viviparus TaxID=29172 RepID=A0A0D8XGV5_DICVI|nr:hypothetical protein DICVIV_11034 [Dictyocaulus viviparus]
MLSMDMIMNVLVHLNILVNDVKFAHPVTCKKVVVAYQRYLNLLWCQTLGPYRLSQSHGQLYLLDVAPHLLLFFSSA